MTVHKDLNKVSFAMKLNNGTKDGKVQTLSLSIGKIYPDRYDEQKAVNVASLLVPCLAKELYAMQETTVSTITAS